jgi:hypothetical protein
MSKSQTNLLSVSKFLSNDSKVQFNLNECIVEGPDGEMIVMGLCKDNLYEINIPRCIMWMRPIDIIIEERWCM